MLQKTRLKRVIISACFVILGIFISLFSENTLISNILFILAWIISGIDIFRQAVINLKNNHLLAEHFLMSVATIGAFAIGEYMEAAMVMVLYQIGEIMEGRAINKSRESIASLMNIAAPVAFKIDGDKRIEIDPDDIEIGDLLEVRAGEKIPVDGTVVKGESYLDTSALTGESMPKHIQIGDSVLSGAMNTDGWFVIRAIKTAENSTAMRIMQLLEEATENQAKVESFITKFAKVYTPIVVMLALFVAFLPPLMMENQELKDWFVRGLTFLVVSCPCAFIISVPMAFVSGIGVSSKVGILVRGGDVLETIAGINVIGMDKTGTITEGTFKVLAHHEADGVSLEEITAVTYEAEKGSTHPIAMAIRNFAESMNISSENNGNNGNGGKSENNGNSGERAKNIGIDENKYINNRNIEFEKIETISGRGIRAHGNGVQYIFGNTEFMSENGFELHAKEDDCYKSTGTIIHVAEILPVKKYMGHFVIKDVVKANARDVIQRLHSQGVSKVAMLTGDSKYAAEEISEIVGVDEVRSGLLPQQKLEWVKEIKKDNKKVAFVGDGLNDAPVLATSDVGIAMGGIGSDAAIEASGIVLMNDDLESIPKAIYIAGETKKVASQNIAFSIIVKVFFLIITTAGLTQMWMAVFADVGVSLLAVMNSLRLFRIPKKIERGLY